MQTETYTRNIYEYNELSEEAKEKVKQMFSEWQAEDSYIFTEDCEFQLGELFPGSDLEVDYDLSYSQGDHFSIYGEIALRDLLNNIKDKLSDEEYDYLNTWIDWDPITYKIEYKSYYYDQEDFSYDLRDDMEYNKEPVNEKIFEKFNQYSAQFLSKVSGDLEAQGYDFFWHEFTDDEAREMAEANEYEFYKDGTLV